MFPAIHFLFHCIALNAVFEKTNTPDHQRDHQPTPSFHFHFLQTKPFLILRRIQCRFIVYLLLIGLLMVVVNKEKSWSTEY